MTEIDIKSRLALKTVSALGVLALSAAALAGCAATTTETEATESETSAAATTTPGGCELGPEQEGDLTLKLGTALPLTGNLAFLGPPEEAGVALAIKDINEAGKGITIEATLGDSGDTDNKAYDTEIPRLLNAGVEAVIGAASSGTSLQFIDRLVAECVIQFSPANTSPAFSTYEDKGLYFRTAPSDLLQGEVLGNLIAADGHQKISMIVLNDSYGTGLAEVVKSTFEAAGGEVVAEPTYNTGDTNFTSQISEALAPGPDAIVLITFEEVTTILPELVAQFPAKNLYFVDGNLKEFGADLSVSLEGAKGTVPGINPATIAEFVERMDANWQAQGNPKLEDLSYGPESYDAVVLLALAALEARSTEGANMSMKLQEVSGGTGNGQKCTTFAECADIINAGGTADYDGASGPVTFDEVGDPTEANILVKQYGKDNLTTVING